MKLTTAANYLLRVGARSKKRKTEKEEEGARSKKRKTEREEEEDPYRLPQELHEKNPKGCVIVVQSYSHNHAMCAPCALGNATGREISNNQVILDLAKSNGDNSRPETIEDYEMAQIIHVLDAVSMTNTGLHGKSAEAPQFIDDPNHRFHGMLAHAMIDIGEQRDRTGVHELQELLPSCNYAILLVRVKHQDENTDDEDHLIALRKVDDLLYLLPGEIGGSFMKGTPRAFIWALYGDGREVLREHLANPFGEDATIEFLTLYLPIDGGNPWIPMDEFESLGEYMAKLRKFPPLLPNQEYNEVFNGRLPFLHRILLLDDENILHLDVLAGEQTLDEIVNNCLNENDEVESRFSEGEDNE
eukprot:scaffold15049_cov36-Cyclotella_meneghiniana.AAC.4